MKNKVVKKIRLLIKRLAYRIIKSDIERFEKLVNTRIQKLEDGIIDDNKEVLMGAMYNVGVRRNQKLKWTWGRKKNVTKNKAYTILY